jgi:hypothetical protein
VVNPPAASGPDAAEPPPMPFALENITELHRFIALNAPNWQPLPSSRQKLLVCVFPSPPALTAAGLMTQAICRQHNLEPLAILYGSAVQKDISRALFTSFGVREFVDIDQTPRIGWWARRGVRLRLLAHKFAAAIDLQNALDDFVANFRVRGVKIGDLLYDFFIRNGQNYHLWADNRKRWFKHVKEHTASFLRHMEFFQRHDVGGILVCDPVYCFPDAFFLRLAQRFNARVWITTGRFCREYQETDDFEFDRYRFSAQTIARSKFPASWESEIDAYLSKRFSGKIEHFDVQGAYGSKKAYTRESFLEAIGVAPADPRPLIFLMPHCFSDANHKCQGHLYRDFFTWYRATLAELPKCKDAIWVVRPHPSGRHYGEAGIAEKYFREVEAAHVRLAPQDLSTDTVLDLARAVITVNGTIGLEAACRGVPIVISANAIYAGLGFTTEPRTRDEYFRVLSRLHQVSPLTGEQIRAARRALFFYHVLSRPRSRGVTLRVIRPGSSPQEVLDGFNLAYREMADGLESHGWKSDALWIAIQRMLQEQRPVATQPVDWTG